MDTTKTPKKEKPNRAERRARIARQRHLEGDRRRSNAAYMAQEAADARRERVQRQVEAARARKEARDAIKAEIAKKEGVSVRRVVLNGEGEQYTIRPSGEAEAKRKQAERKARQAKYDRKMARKSA